MAEARGDIKCKVIPDMITAGIEIKTMPDKGRGLFATKSFKKDDVLFEESPLAGCQFPWNEDYGYLACHYCMRPLETSEDNVRRLTQSPTLELPFKNLCLMNPANHTTCVCGVKYCSRKCQEYAWSEFHAVLCVPPGSDQEMKLKNLREVWKTMHYPPETATVMLIIRLFAFVHLAENKDAAISQLQNFVMNISNEEGDMCHKLLGPKFKTDIDKLKIAVEQTLQSLELDIPSTWKTSDAFLRILGLIARNGQGIGTSSFNEWISRVELELQQGSDEYAAFDTLLNDLYAKIEDVCGVEFMNIEGSGLYSLQSKLNHSCDPNVEVAFTNGNHTLAIRALQDILPGHEICSSYLDSCTLSRSRESRQAALRENYLFTCLCPKCEAQAGDTSMTSDEEDMD